MNIFLIGFMGSGKSTIGKKLASRLQFQFLDMDREIETSEQKTIAHIFKEQGEDSFRLLEKKWLENFDQQGFVISTGGGTPCFYNNLEVMKSKGKTVFLNVSPNILAQRLFQPNQTRPMLANYIQSQKQLEDYVTKKLQERFPIYEQCDIALNATSFDSKKMDELVMMISSHKEQN